MKTNCIKKYCDKKKLLLKKISEEKILFAKTTFCEIWLCKMFYDEEGKNMAKILSDKFFFVMKQILNYNFLCMTNILW